MQQSEGQLKLTTRALPEQPQPQGEPPQLQQRPLQEWYDECCTDQWCVKQSLPAQYVAEWCVDQ